MKLQQAISKYLTDNIPGLYAFKDEIAFVSAGNPYPYFLVDLISTRRRNLGTGLTDISLSDSDGAATQVKVTKHHQVLRFTVRAVNTAGKNGNEVVAEICDRIETLLSDLCRMGSVNLVDPASSETVHIEQVIFRARSDLAPIEKGMPFVYQQALSFEFVEHRFRQEAVSAKLNKINIAL